MIRNRPFDFLNESDAGNADRAFRLHEVCEIVRIKVVRAEVRKRIDTNDCIEKVGGEGQRVRVGVKRKYTVVNTCVLDALNVLRSAEPEIRCPDLDTELSPEKNRRR